MNVTAIEVARENVGSSHGRRLLGKPRMTPRGGLFYVRGRGYLACGHTPRSAYEEWLRLAREYPKGTA